MRILTAFPDLARKTLHIATDSSKSQIGCGFVGGQPPPTRLLACGQYAATPSLSIKKENGNDNGCPDVKILSPVSQIYKPFEGFVLDEQEKSLSPQIISVEGDFGGWNYMIFEKYTNSSQIDRFKHCTAPNPIFAIALDGKGFHGQHHRIWQTGLGNLYISTFFPVSNLHISDFPQRNTWFHQVPCQAVIKALSQIIQFSPSCMLGIKPPNDIVITILDQTYKLGGCLTEIAIQGNQITSLRMGIGLNIQFAPNIPSTEGLPAACCSSFHQNSSDDLFFPLLKSIAANLYEAVSSDSAVSSFF